MTIQLNRRQFLKLTGVSCSGLILASSPLNVLASDDVTLANLKPDAYLQIDESNQIIFWAPRPELGQGTKTGLALTVAEELDVNLNEITVEHANTSTGFGYIGVGGSYGLQGAYQRVRETAARAKLMIKQAAAEKWQTTVDKLTTENGYVIYAEKSKKLPYGEFVAAAIKLEVPKEVELKSPDQFTQIGTEVKRYDNNNIVLGKAQYGLDIKFPNMLYASIERSPTPNGTVKQFNKAQLLTDPSVKAVIKLEGTGFPHENHMRAGIAVLASSHWQAIKLRQKLQVSWHQSKVGINSKDIADKFSAAASGKGNLALKKGNTEQAFTQSDNIIKASYQLPFLAHSAMETPNATAIVTENSCKIWCGIQSATRLQERLVTVLGLKKEQIIVYPLLCGGSFGRRLEIEYAVEAAVLSQKTQLPVQVLWSREDDIQLGQFRTASQHQMAAAIENNEVTALTEHAAIMSVAQQQQMTDAFKDGVDTYYEDASSFLYGIDNMEFQQSIIEADVPVGWWRGVSATNYSVAYECWIDEIAHHLKQDPINYRIELLNKARIKNAGDNKLVTLINRMIFVLNKVAELTNWHKRQESGLGVACFHFGSRSPVATVVETRITNNQIKVVKITSVVDCGLAVNPDLIRAQFEGGAIFGLSSVFHQQITIENGAVKQSNFHDYGCSRFSEVPEIETYILPSTEAPQGVGEPSVMTIAPAVLNSIFNATGNRYRSLPINNHI